MNKITSFLFAFALIIGLNQCKKNVETVQSVPDGVYITLDVDGGQKAIVDPHGGSNYATVNFEQGDVIYVGNNGAYCGYLEHDGTKFAGNITPTSADDTDFLHFYFMGNKGPVGSAPSSVDISDQTAKYPVISYGRSTQLYNSVLTNYSATLYNKCAIMSFNVSGVNTNDVVTITGMNNAVTVDFSKNNGTTTGEPYTYSKSGNGNITLHTEANGERWAILLPQAEVTNATAYAIGYQSPSTFTVPAVSANGYYDSGATLTFVAAYDPHGVFTVNELWKPVRFSASNLQYNKATGKFSFMEHPWSTVETKGQDVGDDYANQNIVSLFGWGTSGWNNGNVFYQPYNTTQDITNYSADIGWGYGPTDGTNYNYDLTGTYANADWGVYNRNKIEGGGDHAWRVLTKDEWVWILGPSSGVIPGTNCRASSTVNGVANARFALSIVNSKSGLIIFPDNYTHPDGVAQPNNINDCTDSYLANNYSTTQWTSMESAGAVFLPVVGCRMDANVVADNYLRYWSSSAIVGTTSAHCMYYSDDYGPVFEPSSNALKNFGSGVRLVYDVQ